jgi:UPF0176 protein
MKRALLLPPLLLVALAACAQETDDPTVTTTTPVSTASETQAGLPTPPQPANDGPCPYLEESYVEDTNGQHVGKTQTSTDNPPACFFYRPDGGLQLTVWVYNGGDAHVAKGLVDGAAPVDTANPAKLPGGWEGGAQPTDKGAVYAVAKDGAAVIVTTNQEQTIKAKQIAQQSITALGL